MKFKTLIALAVAGAFAVPFAAQASASGDRIILAAGPSGAGSTGTGMTGGTPSTQSSPAPSGPGTKSQAGPGSDTATTPGTSGKGKAQ